MAVVPDLRMRKLSWSEETTTDCGASNARTGSNPCM